MKYFIILALFFSQSAYAGLTKDDCITAQCFQLKINQKISVQYERAIDGSTFHSGTRKIRLWGIDAPDSDSPFYEVSKLFLHTFLHDSGDELKCTFIEKDKYERDVMRCFVGTMDIGSSIVLMGLAKDDRFLSDGFYQHEEQLAKESKRGLWSTN